VPGDPGGGEFMLILSRRIDESIVIDGYIVVTVTRIDDDSVKLGIKAPAEVPVHREEIQRLIERKGGRR
jgi:carbon storage regulator